MEPHVPKSRASLRRFLRERADDLFRRSPEPSRVSSTSIHLAASPHSRLDEGSDHTVPASAPDITAPEVMVSPPLLEPLNEFSGVWSGLEEALKALKNSAALFPPVQSAADSLLTCLDVLEAASNIRQDYQELTSNLTSVVTILAQHMGPSTPARMSGSVANFARGIGEQAKMVESKRVRGTGRRLLEASKDLDDLARCYRRIGELFKQLQIDANLSVWSIVNDQLAYTRLESLAPVKLAHYDSKLSTGISRRTCTEGTRTAILSELNTWSYASGEADLYWMNGMAGTGKTTIACSFSEALEARRQLAASFFCTRTVPDCRDVSRIIPTIAYQLAQYSIPFQSALCEVLSEDPNVSAKNIAKQFARLLEWPLLQTKDAIPSGLVVVVDALDECDDMLEVELLLSVLLKSAAELPLKFFVTSRPEPEIYNRMVVRGQGYRALLHLHEVEMHLVQADIELFLQAELEFMTPTNAQIKQLARRSGKLFIYAATLVRYIGSRRTQVDPHERLSTVLSMTAEATTKQYAAIDTLYATVLQAALNDNELEPEEVEHIRRVLRTVICVQEPVSIKVLAALAGLNNESWTLSALQPLRAVVHVSETNGLVSTFHASFPDFMFDKSRSGSLSCDPALHNELLTRHCFRLMESELEFNICRLESSYVPDSAVEDIEGRVKRAISGTLWYACWYWSDHLRQSAYLDELCAMLNDFLSNRLLFWMEVLNLKGEIGMGLDVLLKAKQWIQRGSSPTDVARLAEDARNFVTSFAANPVSKCTPHIYLSSLPFCPKSSLIFKHYWQKMTGLVNLTGSIMQMREAAALACWKTESEVLSIAYSPDGRHVAFGGADGTITIRGAHDGTLIAGPFKAHTGSVYSVTYSPDGAHIASGSSDKAICICSAHDGTLVVGPLKGHSGLIRSVAYSPDGSHIVSGSGDKSIRVWNANDGTLAAGPFQVHKGPVYSVAYSPDGSWIVSGSSDKTIKVCNATDGTVVVANSFIGHTGSVLSVAYSPDGTRIVSSSSDRTIRLWNASDGTLVTGPLQGHTHSVGSITYSPDGTRIVSGSSDNTILVWDAAVGTLVAGPFHGHSNSVVTVAYSPDGTRIVSGSSDSTIRVWSTHEPENTPFTTLLEGHSNSVRSVAYSPDGTRIVSCSDDRSIRVWNADNGTPIGSSFQGHTDSVLSVDYSPDGTYIVSGSRDGTLRAWDAQDGTLAADPFKGHTNLKSVMSVVYSPDGNCIASGSDDNTVRVWSADDGTLVADPFKGHTGIVYSVAYSPNGSFIASGSGDNTVRVWDAEDGTQVAGPFQGHSDSVMSVAYSPDGAHIVSGSNDTTIRVWNASDGTPVVNPLQGHSGPITAVAYSPNGTYVVSGSSDNTIRIWNVDDGIPITGPLQGHTGPVFSVAYSPDGTRIVSSSSDSTIRVWNANIRGLTTDPSTEHPEAPHLAGDDGWVMNSASQLLFWMPRELKFAHMSPSLCCVLVIGRGGSLNVDYGDVCIGQRWRQCYLS